MLKLIELREEMEELKKEKNLLEVDIQGVEKQADGHWYRCKSLKSKKDCEAAKKKYKEVEKLRNILSEKKEKIKETEEEYGTLRQEVKEEWEKKKSCL